MTLYDLGQDNLWVARPEDLLFLEDLPPGEVTAPALERDVVMRIPGCLPHLQRTGRIDDRFAGQNGADPPRNRLDVVGRHDRRRVVAHVHSQRQRPGS